MALLFAACVQDIETGKLQATRDEMALVTLSLSTPATRAEATTAENAINAIDVLLFDEASDEFAYRAHGTEIANQGSEPYATKKFEVRLPIGGPFKVVVLANARAAIQTASASLDIPISTIVTSNGNSRATVLNSIVHAAIPGKTNFPMWGELTAPVTISETSASITPDIQLTRAVARVDVSLAGTIAPATFVLDSVLLYNYNKAGHVAPEVDASGDYGTGSYPVAGARETDKFIRYDPDPQTAYTEVIYAFEAVNIALSESKWKENTCLVIGGKFDKSENITYYRVDFTRDNAPLDLTRNHLYNVVIQEVKDHGWPTPWLAYINKPSNVVVEITAWNDGGASNVVFDGHYHLSVDQTRLDFYMFYANGYEKTIRVNTDHPDGWTVTGLPEWLTVTSDESGDADTPYDLTIMVGALAPGDSDREEEIYIKAGNLTMPVLVKQFNVTELSLSLVNEPENTPVDYLLFDECYPNSIIDQIRLNWHPASRESIVIATSPGPVPFEYTSGYPGFDKILSIPGETGTRVFTFGAAPIIPDDILPAEPLEVVRSSWVHFILTIDGQQKVAPLHLKQVHGPVVIADPAYLMDGGAKTFNVRSYYPFTIEKIRDDDHVLSNFTNATCAADISPSGASFSFTLIDDMTARAVLESDVTFRISSPTGEFPDKLFTITGNSNVQSKSNSYLLAPGGKGILIPVGRCNESDLGALQLGASEAFTSRLVWTDNSRRVALNSAVRKYGPVGTGSDGYLYVRPGAGAGNAVIAIENTGGAILWSWHVWVPEDQPAVSGSKGLMDRNLGATTKTPGLASTLGLYYQWGRKDPFPGSSSIVSATEPTLYTESNTPQISKVEAPVVSEHPGNIGLTVANPLTYYYVVSNEGADWYGGGSKFYKDDLWKPSPKTVYDPCPPGWRVPKMGKESDSPWYGLNTSNFQWNNTNKGCYSEDYGGFYPAAGFRIGHTDSFGLIGWFLERVMCWSSSAYTNYQTAYIMYVESPSFGGSFRLDEALSRTFSLPVRCVHE
jgi:hypothetical protein